MNVFHFGNAKGPLFGVHHEPAPAQDLNCGVVLCAPMGLEYIRSYWCLRRLADRMAGAGIHVMRFDYTGQGDSWGGDEDVSLDQWTRDVLDAVEELRDASGAQKISLVGLRLGAALACLAASRDAKIEKLILWDPVSEGSAYLEQLRDLHQKKLARWKFARESYSADESEELIGRVWPAALMTEIAAFTVPDTPPPVREIHILGSVERSGDRLFGERWSHGAVAQRVIETAGDWDVLDEMDEALLAGPIEEAIAHTLAGSVS